MFFFFGFLDCDDDELDFAAGVVLSSFEGPSVASDFTTCVSAALSMRPVLVEPSLESVTRILAGNERDIRLRVKLPVP